MDSDGRKDDVILERLDQKFTDFVDRYERDWRHTQAWRIQHDQLIQANTDFINEFKPVYKKGILLVGLIMTGTIGIAVKTFWDHIKLFWR